MSAPPAVYSRLSPRDPEPCHQLPSQKGNPRKNIRPVKPKPHSNLAPKYSSRGSDLVCVSFTEAAALLLSSLPESGPFPAEPLQALEREAGGFKLPPQDGEKQGLPHFAPNRRVFPGREFGLLVGSLSSASAGEAVVGDGIISFIGWCPEKNLLWGQSILMGVFQEAATPVPLEAIVGTRGVRARQAGRADLSRW